MPFSSTTTMFNMDNAPSLPSYDDTKFTQLAGLPPTALPNSLSELEDFPGLLQTATVDQPYVTGYGYSVLSPAPLGPPAYHHVHSKTAPSSPIPGPVASKTMLEANSWRRRHPAQFRCDKCEETFTALFSLKRHQQSHTSERPFVCSISGCMQRFYNSSDCKRHERSRKRHEHLVVQ